MVHKKIHPIHCGFVTIYAFSSLLTLNMYNVLTQTVSLNEYTPWEWHCNLIIPCHLPSEERLRGGGYHDGETIEQPN